MYIEAFLDRCGWNKNISELSSHSPSTPSHKPLLSPQFCQTDLRHLNLLNSPSVPASKVNIVYCSFLPLLCCLI